MASNDSQGENNSFKLKLGQTDREKAASDDSDDDDTSSEEENESTKKSNVEVNEASDLVDSADS